MRPYVDCLYLVLNLVLSVLLLFNKLAYLRKTILRHSNFTELVRTSHLFTLQYHRSTLLHRVGQIGALLSRSVQNLKRHVSFQYHHKKYYFTDLEKLEAVAHKL